MNDEIIETNHAVGVSGLRIDHLDNLFFSVISITEFLLSKNLSSGRALRQLIVQGQARSPRPPRPTSRRGRFLIKWKTRRDRMRAKLLEIKQELRQRMHQQIHEQGQWIKQVVGGYFRYHAVPTNIRALKHFLAPKTLRTWLIHRPAAFGSPQ